MQQKYFINTEKAATAAAVLVMMAAFQQWGNPTAWIYLALHGSYGILWALKSRFYPDLNLQAAGLMAVRPGHLGGLRSIGSPHW